MSSACPHKIWQNQPSSVPVPSEEILQIQKLNLREKNQYCEIVHITENQSGKTSESDGKSSTKNSNVKQFPDSFSYSQVQREQIERKEYFTVHILDNLLKVDLTFELLFDFHLRPTIDNFAKPIILKTTNC